MYFVHLSLVARQSHCHLTEERSTVSLLPHRLLLDLCLLKSWDGSQFIGRWTLHWRVISATSFVYTTRNISHALTERAQDALRAVAKTMTSEELLSHQHHMDIDLVQSMLAQTVESWGIQIIGLTSDCTIEQIASADVAKQRSATLTKHMNAYRITRSLDPEEEAFTYQRTIEDYIPKFTVVASPCLC